MRMFFFNFFIRIMERRLAVSLFFYQRLFSFNVNRLTMSCALSRDSFENTVFLQDPVLCLSFFDWKFWNVLEPFQLMWVDWEYHAPYLKTMIEFCKSPFYCVKKICDISLLCQEILVHSLTGFSVAPIRMFWNVSSALKTISITVSSTSVSKHASYLSKTVERLTCFHKHAKN